MSDIETSLLQPAILDELLIYQEKIDETPLDFHDEFQRNEDKDEETIINSFLRDGCGCKLGKNNTCCSTMFQEDELIVIRSNNLQLTNDELDLVVMAQIRSAHNTRSSTSRGEKRKHDYAALFYHGQRICRKTFLVTNCIGHIRYETLYRHYKLNGLVPRRHGNTKRLPPNYKKLSGKAVSLPGRYPGYKDLDVVLLPTSDTKVSVWKFYLECCEADHVVGMKYSTFCQKWQELTPYIIIMKPRSDLCWTCQSNHDKP